jgi:hypothetical protein
MVYTTVTFNELERNMYQPPAGTIFHCIPECFKGYHHKWPSDSEGVPKRCSHCKSPYHDKFPKRVTKQMVINHLCPDCLKAWNELKAPEAITREEIINMGRQDCIDMWNEAYKEPKYQITSKDLQLKQKATLFYESI